MKKSINRRVYFVKTILALSVTLLVTRKSPAAELLSTNNTDSATAEAGSSGGIDKADKTGTNPLNFQRSAQVVNEFDSRGGAQVDYTRFRFTQPFDDGRMSLRLEVPLVYAHAALAESSSDENGGGSAIPSGDASRFGLGDIGLKYSYVPYVSRSGGLLTSLEMDAPTATSSVLGTGKWLLAPTIAYGFFLPESTIFAPSYKQNFSFAGNSSRSDVNSGSLDLYLVKKFNHGRQWITIDPTYILNYQADKYSGATLRVIGGSLLGKIGNSVLSGYIKPGIGIGHDRPNNWSLEIGVSLIGF